MEASPVSLSSAQRDRLIELQKLALAFNAKLNLYSHASAEEFIRRHIVHSLVLATRPSPAGSVVADWGTGGGMPGLVLAIAFPGTPFHLIDSVAKKIRAVQTMARRLGLENVEGHHARAEHWEGRITHSVSRATAPLDTLWGWHMRVQIPFHAPEGTWEPGLICLKGGELEDEIAPLREATQALHIEVTPLSRWLGDPYFEGKKLVQVVRATDRRPEEK